MITIAVSPEQLEQWNIEACERWNVEPAFGLAVMRTEGGYRTGLIGRKKLHYGPMCVHKDFAKKFNVNLNDPKVCIEIGIRALRNVGDNKDKQIARLKTYNKTWYKDNYIRDVMITKKQYQKKLKERGLLCKSKNSPSSTP
jgi:hypothetical protein